MMNPLPNDFSVTLFDHSALPFCIIKVELDEKAVRRIGPLCIAMTLWPNWKAPRRKT